MEVRTSHSVDRIILDKKDVGKVRPVPVSRKLYRPKKYHDWYEHRQELRLFKPAYSEFSDLLSRNYSKYYRQMFGYFEMLFGPEAAEDLVSQTFYNALKRYNLRDGRKVNFWLHAVALSTAREYYRKLRSLDMESHARIRMTQKYIQDLQDGDPYQNYKSGELPSIIEKTVKSLPRIHRNLMQSLLFEGKSYEQISKETGRSPKSVKAIIFKMRQTMRSILQEQGIDKNYLQARDQAHHVTSIYHSMAREKLGL